MALHEDLLVLGRELATIDPRRPRQAALRKAVHCAYYAAFGSLCAEWSALFVGAAKPVAARMPDHGKVRQASDAAKGGKLRGNVCHASITKIGVLLGPLQGRRHEADYDPAARLRRREVLRLLDDAEVVIAEVARARKACPEELQIFLLECAGARR